MLQSAGQPADTVPVLTCFSTFAMNGVVAESKSPNNDNRVEHLKKRPKNDIKQNGNGFKRKRTEAFEFGNYNR